MAPTSSRTSTLLLVDDEPFNLEILAEYLTEVGYVVETAHNGEAAWECLVHGGDRFDAVLLDRMMPGLNGMEVLRRMQGNAQLCELPVVMQTAVGSPESIREGMAAGAYYYLTKPFDRDILLAIVGAAVAQHCARKEIRRAAAHPLEALHLLDQASFKFKTLDQAHHVAAVVSRLAPKPERVALGLTELLVNAIEHGNLGVGYDEKKSMMQAGHWREEIDAKQRLPEFSGKQVLLQLWRDDGCLRLRVQDEGEGFDYTKFLDFDPNRAFDPNGRGISMARAMSFDRLQYLGCGNEVEAEIKLN